MRIVADPQLLQCTVVSPARSTPITSAAAMLQVERKLLVDDMSHVTIISRQGVLATDQPSRPQ